MEQNEQQEVEARNKERLEEIETKRREVERLSDDLESSQVEQKQVFLVVFQVLFIRVAILFVKFSPISYSHDLMLCYRVI